MVKFTRKDEKLVIEINLKKLIAIVVSVAVLAVFIGGISVGYALFAPDKRAEMKTGPLVGVDISSNQADNYNDCVGAATDFVICRATANYRVDRTCDKAYQLAKSKGKLLGVYFWANPLKYDPKEYASFCAGTVQGYIGEAIFVLDFEKARGADESLLDPEWAYTWLVEFEKLTGVKPLLYTGLKLAKTKDWSKVIDNGNCLWVASYGNDDGNNHGLPSAIGEWPDNQVVMHQYTTSGFGKRNSLDISVFYEGEASWRELAKRQ